MSPRILAAGMALAMSAGIVGAGIAAGDALAARAVPLSAATVAPSWLRLVKPHRSATVPYRCAVNASDVSAYRWDGRALGPQVWTDTTRLLIAWYAPTGRRVTYDGTTFHNALRVPALVAVWC